jgi:hypothetical protein
MMTGQNLFCQVDMFSVIENQKQQATIGMRQVSQADLESKTEEELVSRIVKKYELEVPVIRDDKIYVAESGESKVDVSGDVRRAIFDHGRPFYIQGTRTVIAVPFEGDAELFKVRPNTFSTSVPTAEIVGQEIRLTYDQVEPNGDAIKTAYTNTLEEIKKYLDWQRSSANEFNSQLEQLARQRFSERKQTIAAGAAIIDALGLPTVRPQ